MFDMRLRRFRSVVHGVFMVAARKMGVVRCRFVIAFFVVLCGFLVMSCRVFVMFCCLVMLFCCLL
jgi:hypothetical protein